MKVCYYLDFMKDLIEIAQKENLISFVGIEKTQICYKTFGRTVSFLEEKEKVRLQMYLEIIYKYRFPKELVFLDFTSSCKFEDIIINN